MEQAIDNRENRKDAVFFTVSQKKFIVMSLVTFGCYELYWFYKNWDYIKTRDNSTIKPFWRAVFSILYCYPLLKEIKEDLDKKEVAIKFDAGMLTTAYVILALTYKLPEPYSIISTFSFIPLLSVQKVVNQLNVGKSKAVMNEEYSRWNVVGIVLGIFLWVLVISGLFLPE